VSTQCQVCNGRSELHLCGVCQSELRSMLQGLAVGQELPNGHRGAGWLEFLEDACNGKTRLGESARRSSEKGSPMLHNERASDLLNNVHDMLIRWVETININTETLGTP
jgi:hypothetical protein